MYNKSDSFVVNTPEKDQIPERIKLGQEEGKTILDNEYFYIFEIASQ